MLVLQAAGKIVQRLCFSRRVGITENSDRRIMLLKLVEITVYIRITEIVVKDDDREIDVRIFLDTIGVVLPNTGCIPQFVGISRERVPVKEADVLRLLCRGIVDSASPKITAAAIILTLITHHGSFRGSVSYLPNQKEERIQLSLVICQHRYYVKPLLLGSRGRPLVEVAWSPNFGTRGYPCTSQRVLDSDPSGR